MRSENAVIQWLIDCGGPITRERYVFFNWFGTPPETLSGEEAAEVPLWLPSADAYPVALPSEDDPGEEQAG
jgi:hypothetical protein